MRESKQLIARKKLELGSHVIQLSQNLSGDAGLCCYRKSLEFLFFENCENTELNCTKHTHPKYTP
jgi:hypothetical protein